MTVAIVACADLMTTSRLTDPQVDVRPCNTVARVEAALKSVPGAVVVVDLTGFPDLPQRLRESNASTRIIGFAPHVREDLIEQARPWCDRVVPRGSVVKRFAAIVLEA